MRRIFVWMVVTAIVVSAAEFRVDSINGAPRILMDGKPIVPVFLAGNFLNGQGRPCRLFPDNEEEIRLAAAHGILVVQMSCRVLYKDNARSLSRLKSAFDQMLAIHPKIYLMPRLVYTNNMDDMPPWAIEDGMLNSTEGDVPIVDNGQKHPSIDHPRFREAMRQATRDTIDFLEANYGDRICGYQVAGLKAGEWQYLKFQNHYTGYDVGTKMAFRLWLMRKYGKNVALQQAWGMPDVTFETADVPTPAQRRGTPTLTFHDPKLEQPAIDFAFFRNEDMADAIAEQAAIIRQRCGRTRLIGAFYGYICECTRAASGPVTVGHYALEKLLYNPDIDFLAGPFSYNPYSRAVGGSSVTHTAAESITAAGKLWFNEDDFATPISIARKEYPDSAEREGTWDELFRFYRTHLGITFTRNYALWFYDLHGTNWFNNPDMWKEIERIIACDKETYSQPMPYQPDVFMILDEDSLKYGTASSPELYSGIHHNMRDRLSRASIRSGVYLLNDVLKRNAASKLDVQTAIFAPTASQRKALRKRASTTPTIWMYASGYIDVEKKAFSLEGVRDLTGFSVEKRSARKRYALKVKMTAEGKKLFVGAPDEFGFSDVADPSFAVIAEEGDVVVARFADDESPAVVYRPARNGHAFSMFCSTNELPPALLRELARLSGAQIYCQKDLHINDNGRLLCVTAPADGEYVITPGRDGNWKELLTGKSYGRGQKIQVVLKRGDILHFANKND